MLARDRGQGGVERCCHQACGKEIQSNLLRIHEATCKKRIVPCIRLDKDIRIYTLGNKCFIQFSYCYYFRNYCRAEVPAESLVDHLLDTRHGRAVGCAPGDSTFTAQVNPQICTGRFTPGGGPAVSVFPIMCQGEDVDHLGIEV